MNRQKVLLTILAGMLVLALAYAFRATPRQTKISAAVARTPAAAVPAKGAHGSATADELRVRLELLTRQDGTSPDFKRNIFHFRQPEPKPLPISPPTPPPAMDTAPTLATEEVQRELARFTFLGFLLKEGVRTIFLSANEEIFVVKKGDRFGNNRRFLVAELTPEKLTIRQDDDPRPIIVPLVEQAPLVEMPGPSPAQEVPGRTVPAQRRRPPLQERISEDLRPAELTEPLEPTEPLDPVNPTEPAESAGEAEPVKDPFAVELNPPPGAAPQRGPQ